MRIPTLEDWGDIDPDDLDAKWALKQFLGKSFAEAEDLFASNALHYGEDVQSMPRAVFSYYAPALAKYLTSDRARGDSDGASSFLHMLIYMLKNHPAVIAPDTKDILLKAAEHVANGQPFYEASVEIYGQFSELLAELRSITHVT